MLLFLVIAKVFFGLSLVIQENYDTPFSFMLLVQHYGKTVALQENLNFSAGRATEFNNSSSLELSTVQPFLPEDNTVHSI